MYFTSFSEGMRIYTADDNGITIPGDWLFKSLRDLFSLEIVTYTYTDKCICLYCDYPKEIIIGTKKFFYDNYPYTKVVELTDFGIKIHFGIKVQIHYKPVNLLLLN